MRPPVRIALVALAALVARPTLAATTSPTGTTFNVTATVATACSVSASNLSFGTYDPSVSTDLAAGPVNIAVKCTKNTTATVGALTTTNTFAMKNGAETLNYKLYQDASHATDWSTTASAPQVSASSQTAMNFPVYGVIPANQNVAVGSYSDTVTVSVTFN